MPFIDYVLHRPSYGWQNEQGELIKPSAKEILSEFFSRLNLFKDRKNWLPFFSWFKVACLIPFFLIFIVHFLTWWTILAAFIYSMVIMGTHGTIWHHRYCTHGAYKFRNVFWRFFTQNLTITVIPEEIYIISIMCIIPNRISQENRITYRQDFYTVFLHMLTTNL